MKAIVIGGSGATGKELINQLLLDNRFSEITSFVRKKSEIKSEKLKEIIIDFKSINTYSNQMVANVAFSCLGTTLKAAGSKEAQWMVDYEYQLEFAKICKTNNIKTFVLVSSVGANKNSKIFYSKMKGSLEQKLLKLYFDKLIILQPPSLIRPNSERKGEIIGVKILTLLNKLGLFKDYRPLAVSDLAKCMIQSFAILPDGNHVLKPLDIKKRIPKS